jgi:hypothetical protein
MSRPASLRVTAALLLVLATIVFVIGVMAERSAASEGSETRPEATVTVSSNEQSEGASEEGSESHEEGEAAEGAGEEAHADEATEPHIEANEPSETILGINLESTSTVAAAVVISLLLAAAVYFWGTPATLVVAGAVALLFAALDLREVAHQLSEGRSGLVGVALLAAVLHAGQRWLPAWR